MPDPPRPREGRRTGAAHAPAPARRPPGSWSSRIGVLVCIALVVGGLFLRASNLRLRNPTPDEYFYTIYAVTVHDQGFAHVPEMARLYLADSTLWVYPAPTRVGHLWLAAALMHMTRDVRHSSVQLLSVLSSMAALVLLLWLGLERLGPWPTAVALALLAFSPIDLALARRAWQDSVLAGFSAATLLAWSRSLARPGSSPWLAVFLAVAGYAVLVKETALITLGLGVVGLAFWHARRAGARAALPALVGGAATLLLIVAVLALAVGGLGRLEALYARAFAQGASDEYMRRYQQGSALYYPAGLRVVEPVAFALGIVGAVLAAARAPILLRPWSDRATRDLIVSLGWFVLLFAAIATFSPQKNMRFLSPILAPVCFLAGTVAWAAVVDAKRRLPLSSYRVAVSVAALVLAWTCLTDLARFQRLFVARGIPDLATPYFVGGEPAGVAPTRLPAPPAGLAPGSPATADSAPLGGAR